MIAGDGRTVTKRAVAIITMAGALGVGGALLLPAIAAAEPLPPPIIPGEAPPPATVGAPLAQSGTPNGPGAFRLPDAVSGATLAQSGDPNPGPFGLPAVAFDPGQVLAQNPVPTAPGVDVGVPIPMTFDNSFLLSQNDVPSAPGQGAVVGAPPGGSPNALGYLGELHQANISGRLVGIGFGFRPKEQLGEPLPGTAPAPGIPIPPGLGEDLPAPPPIVPLVPPPG